MEQLYEVIRKVIVDAAELEEDIKIDPNEMLDNYGVDSLAGLEIVVNLEKKYQIKIPPSRYEEIKSIHSISVIVEELLDAKTAQVTDAS